MASQQDSRQMFLFGRGKFFYVCRSGITSQAEAQEIAKELGMADGDYDLVPASQSIVMERANEDTNNRTMG